MGEIFFSSGSSTDWPPKYRQVKVRDIDWPFSRVAFSFPFIHNVIQRKDATSGAG